MRHLTNSTLQYLKKNNKFNSFIAKLSFTFEFRSSYSRWQTFKDAERYLSRELQQDPVFLKLKRRIFIEYCTNEYENALNANSNGNGYQLEYKMNIIHKELWEAIELFALGKNGVKNIIQNYISEIKKISTPNQLQQIPSYILHIGEISKIIAPDEESQMALVLLCSSAIFREIAPRLQLLKNNRRGNVLYEEVNPMVVFFVSILMFVGLWVALFS